MSLRESVDTPVVLMRVVNKRPVSLAVKHV